MQKPLSNKLQKAQRIMLSIVGVLIIGVLILSLFCQNIVMKTRSAGDYMAVQNVVTTQLDGKIEYRFKIEKIEHSETMAFYVNHHEVEVYLGNECVYSINASQMGIFATVGGTWVSLPLYDDDCGKEVRVVLTPVYDDYSSSTPEFLLGSEIALHNVTLHRALPALVLCLSVMFAGFFVICLAAYHNAKGMFSGRLYALGMMALSVGAWRLTYDRAIYLLLPDKAVTLYTLSIVSMMGLALSMLSACGTDNKERKYVRWCSCCYCAAYIVQLLLQLTGVADLRQTLKVIHATLIISAVMFMFNSIKRVLKQRKDENGRSDLGWMLGIGVIIDLLIYYFAKSSFNMVTTLVAILCYTVLDGIQLLFFYVEQKNALEEMKTQLTLSRTTTMMSQIRSHFVFNVLNAISGLCKYDPEKADETVVRFARYLRNNIDIMEKDGNIPFSTDLHQIEDYVALEQVRFGDKIEFYTDIETDSFMIPPLILQPVVENAIKHGVSKKKGNGNIILRTRDDGENIVITVEDDGVGFDMTAPEKEKSVGLRNIRFRLEHLVHGTLEIQSEVGKGTTATIKIPKEGN